MKLSEMTTEKSFDVICEITPFIGNIIEDKKLMESLKKTINVGQGASQAAIIAAGLSKINRLVPIVFKGHKEDICGVLAVIFETPADEILRQNIIKTMIMIREVVKDKDLVDFFKSCVA